MKKIIWIILLYLFSYINVFADGEIFDIKIKKTTESNTLYSNGTTLSDLKNGNSINIRIQTVWLFTSNNYFSLSLPAWLSYSWHTISNLWCVSFNNAWINNSSIYYSYSWVINPITSTIRPCLVELTYTLNTISAWTHNMNLLYWWNQKWSITMPINSIASAFTRDLNGDWYLDAYELIFNNPITNTSDLSNLTIWWISVNSYSWSTNSWYILFNGSIFSTWDKPQLLVTNWNVFWNIWTISSSLLEEQDWAKPVLLSNNSQSWVISSTWNIVLTFSEALKPTTTTSFTLTKSWWTIFSLSWSLSFNLKELTLEPNLELEAWDYILTSNSWVKDFWDNILDNVNLSLKVLDTKKPTWSIQINSWATTTQDKNVQLTLSWSDDIWVNNILISNNSNFDTYTTINNTTSTWWTLDISSWTWTKNVYVKYVDLAWNESITYTGSIIFDNTKLFICNPSLLPANASWNSVSNYMQTLTWSTWLPIDSTPTYNLTLSTTSCNFKCNDWYNWNSSTLSCLLQISNSSTSSLSAWTSSSGWSGSSSTSSSSSSNVNNLTKSWSTQNISKTDIKIDNSITLNNKEVIKFISENKDKEFNIENINIYLSTKTSKDTKKILELFEKKLIFDDLDYYISFDKDIKNNYNELLNTYMNLILNLDNYLLSKDKDLINIIIIDNKKLNTLYKSLKSPENKYITKSNNNKIYKTNYEELKEPLNKVEDFIFKKLNLLKSSNNITLKQYNQSIKDYNNFILNITISKKYNNKEALKKALEKLELLKSIYNKKIN